MNVCTELVRDYLIATNRAIYLESGGHLGEPVPSGEGFVRVTEVSHEGSYRDSHAIALLDLIAWVHSQQKLK